MTRSTHIYANVGIHQRDRSAEGKGKRAFQVENAPEDFRPDLDGIRLDIGTLNLAMKIESNGGPHSKACDLPYGDLRRGG